MGMFDYIKCEVPLPDGWSGELQSKDFDCEMVTHVISSDGRLMVDRGHNEMVPLLERPYWKAEWGNDEAAEKKHPLEALQGCMRRVKNYVDSKHHGMVRFYGTETIGKDAEGYPKYKWHEYSAKFTDGQLMSIEAVSAEPIISQDAQTTDGGDDAKA